MGKTAKIRRGRQYAYPKEDLAIRTAPCPTPAKVPHASRASAKRAKRQQHRTPGVNLSIYRCVCGCYHVGSLPHDTRAQARAIAQSKLKRA